MAYRALYRKYRPQNFSQVVGQSAIVKTLQNAIIGKKTTHAYLFCGPRGTGKTSVARIFAKALNCLNLNNGEPCCTCTNCKEISESMSPDVIEIDAASNNGVDEIRDIREKVKFLPSGAKHKIYIIDEVHMLSTGAFNALLKTLEEPPKHVIFILATTEPQKLPSTIISRCQRYDFKPLSTFDISVELKKVCDKEDAYITDDAINAISEAAEGGMRDALSILDQVISYGNKDISIDDVNTITGTIGFDKMCLLMEYIESKNVNNALDMLSDFVSQGKEVSKILGAMLAFSRDVLLYKSIGNKNTNKYIFEKDRFQELAFKLFNSKIMYYIDILCDVQNKIKYSTTPNVYLEISIIKMCNVNDSDLDLIKRISDVEEKIENGNFSNLENVASDIDSEKLGLLDAKINQVVTQLNKMELPKLSQRVDDLSQIIANRINNSENGHDVTKDLDEIKAEIDKIKNDSLVNSSNEELLAKIEKLEEQLESPVQTQNIDTSKFNKEFENLYKKISDIENALYDVIDNDALNSLKDELNALKNNQEAGNISNGETKVDSQLLIEINKLKEEINRLKNASFETDAYDSSEIDEIKANISGINDDLHILKTKPVANSNDLYDLSEIKEKLETLEGRMYKFISGALAQSKSKPKPIKKPNGQIMLFGDEILSVDYLEKETKIDIDFEDVSKDDLDDNLNEEIIEINEEKVESEVIDTNQEIEESDITEDIADDQSEENTEESLFEVDNLENEVSEPEAPKIEEKPKDEILQQYFDIETKETVITKKNSSMIVREREEGTQDQIMSSIMKHESARKVEDEVVEEPVIQEVAKPREFVDKFASYNIKDIEQLLFESQSQEARNDKSRVAEVWKTLSRGLSPDQMPISQMLQEATIVAVGNKELILTYPSVNECNQVMRAKFKRNALRLIYNKLNDTYNYIALPAQVWQEKRLEYVRQYQIGIRKPTLTPFNIKGLNIIDDKEEFINKEEKLINKAIDFFGNDIVKVEQED